jgi:hypothetical protein
MAGAVALAGACAGLAVLAACSTPAALLGQGSQCLQTTDCEDGLFCVPQMPGQPKICSSNLATTVATEEAGAAAPKDAAATGDAKPPSDAAAPPSDAPTAPPPEASPPDDSGSSSSVD